MQAIQTRQEIFFSEHFSLRRTQEELECVDIPLTSDIPLYVDPYAFKIGTDLWSIECNNLVVDYFQSLIEAIRSNDDQRVRFLLNNLHEPNLTHFGLSRGRPSGRGIGGGQALDLYEKLKQSKAAKSGVLRDLSDCELMIPGIGHDKISDITINIIRPMLVHFTEMQCRLLGVPTKNVQAGPGWDAENATWTNSYGQLPTYNGRAVLLIPKRSVRYKCATDHSDYYSNFVLEFLQQEHLDSNSSLVQVLKHGKRRVTKAALEKRYPCNKDFLFEFSQGHPNVLQNYREFLPLRDAPVGDAELNAVFLERFGRNPDGVTINIQTSEVVMQKNTVHGNVIGSVVGSGTINARDISAYSQHLEESSVLPTEAKAILLDARKALADEKISVAEQHDAADNLGKLTQELEKSQKEEGLIRRYFNRIKEVAPTVASLLSSIKAVGDIAKLLG